MSESFLKKFFLQEGSVYVVEFGHSALDNTKTIGPWSRDIYILHYIVKGYCDFSGFRADEGQAFLISKELRHSFTVSADYEHYWIGFDGDGVEDMFKIFSLSNTPHQLFFVEHADLAKSLFEGALKNLQIEDTKMPDSVALSVLMSLLPLVKKEKYSAAPLQFNYAEKVQRLIQTNYMYPIKMEEIAKEIHITEKYMYRLFLERYHISPQKFLLKTRMEMAKKMLTETDLSVKEVAKSVGYSSLPSFSKAFFNYFGIRPGLLKKNK